MQLLPKKAGSASASLLFKDMSLLYLRLLLMIKPFHLKLFQVLSLYFAAGFVNIMETYLKCMIRDNKYVQTYRGIQGKKLVYIGHLDWQGSKHIDITIVSSCLRFLRREWKEDEEVAGHVVGGRFYPAWRAEGEKAQRWGRYKKWIVKIQEVNSEDSVVNREDMERWGQAMENLKGQGKQCKPHNKWGKKCR